MGLDYACAAIRKNDVGWQIRIATCRNADQGTPEPPTRKRLPHRTGSTCESRHGRCIVSFQLEL